MICELIHLNMAELHLYKCKKCGWEIESPKDGTDILMFGGIASFICKDCNHVFVQSFEFGGDDETNTKCPQCGSANTTDWKPKDGCPKCGGELNNQGLVCMMD